MINSISDIHESMVNGQRKQAVDQIRQYSGDFWQDYYEYLLDIHPCNAVKQYMYYRDITITYLKLKGENGL